jgi:hypothetical protein
VLNQQLHNNNNNNNNNVVWGRTQNAELAMSVA